MSFFGAMNIAASGLTAERTAMDVTTENLANENTAGYTPQAVELQAVSGSGSFESELSSALSGGGASATAQQMISGGSSAPEGVEVSAIVNENVPSQLVYDPTSPQANAAGYISEPNVQPVTEETDLMDESDSYQADVTAMETAKTMYQSTLSVLK